MHMSTDKVNKTTFGIITGFPRGLGVKNQESSLDITSLRQPSDFQIKMIIESRASFPIDQAFIG